MHRSSSSPRLFDDHIVLPEGFLYERDFLSVTEEAELLERISALEFGEVRMHGVAARRRIVQFGWRYSFDSRALGEGRAMPSFLATVRERVAEKAGVGALDFSEVLVTEYRPGATIGWHRDAPPFGIVAGISLASACRFRLRRPEGDGWQRTEVLVEPRSLYVMRGAARTAWQHSIPPVDALRYSITFRTLRRPASRTVRPA